MFQHYSRRRLTPVFLPALALYSRHYECWIYNSLRRKLLLFSFFLLRIPWIPMLIRRQPSFTIHHLHFKSQHPLHQFLLQRIFQHLPFFELIFRLGLSLKATTSQYASRSHLKKPYLSILSISESPMARHLAY